MQTEPRPLPCPFCGSDDTAVFQVADEGACADLGYVYCNGCSARGPIKDEVGDWTRPISAWNFALRALTE